MTTENELVKVALSKGIAGCFLEQRTNMEELLAFSTWKTKIKQGTLSSFTTTY